MTTEGQIRPAKSAKKPRHEAETDESGEATNAQEDSISELFICIPESTCQRYALTLLLAVDMQHPKSHLRHAKGRLCSGTHLAVDFC